jgi:hypothetical protein
LGGGAAWADQYSCIRTSLKAQSMTGNVPDPTFIITYEIPRCLRADGYRVGGMRMYRGAVGVIYRK